MIRTLLLASVALFLPMAASAHEVWIERDGSGPARIYLGEPGDVLPEGGDPEFAKLKAPRLVPASTAPLQRKAGYLEVAVPKGDVRATDDNVFAPWGEAGKQEGVIYYARAGRSDARAVLPLELAPVTAGGNRFVLTREGAPVAGAAVTVVTPDKWSKAFVTDAQGGFTPPLREKGRYIQVANQTDAAGGKVAGGTVATLHRITTTTFVVP